MDFNNKQKTNKYFSQIKTFSNTRILTIFSALFILLPVFSQKENQLWAQTQKKLNIDYYGIVSKEIDSNMSKMTSDLYFTQLCEINNLTVFDKRQSETLTEQPDLENLSKDNFSFFAVISKKENSSAWISTITVIDKNDNSKLSETKEYDSFYKILMEPKSVLQDSLRNLILNNTENPNTTKISLSTPLVEKSSGSKEDATVNNKETILSGNSKVSSTEFLSGTWNGESNIDKIVIMRGGRGFVIFANGASMNITVQLQNTNNSSQIIITQNGKPNASFFPELSRQVALKEAINAKPIQWTFSVTNDNTLTGVKNTLIENDGNAIPTSIDVTWTRKS